MPGSLTTLGRPVTRYNATGRIVFHVWQHVCTQDK